MPLPKSWSSWEFTQKVIRIGHNRAVKKHFRDVTSDDSRSNGRQALKTSLLIRNEDSGLEVINKQIYFQRLVGGDIPIATMPEWWPKRVGSDIPQLTVVWRPPGKKTSYQICIPHYNGDRNPKIPSYRKGSYRGTLTLSDNSKLVVNAASENEADRVIRVLRRYINPKFASGRNPHIGKVKGSGFKEARVVPIVADFYPYGQAEDNRPSWRKYF